MDIYLLSVIMFFAAIAYLIHRDRKNIQVDHHVIFMRRTKRFGDVIDKVAQLSPRFWKVIGTVGIAVCVYVMAYGIAQLYNVSRFVLSGLVTQPALQLILPMPSAELSVGPGFIGIPFWFWIVTIAFILIPHEFFHGIMARADKIRLKSVGLMMLAIFPGAFVEPDEKQLNKAKFITKMRVFAAGSFINIMIAVLIATSVNSMLWEPNIHPGVILGTVNDSAPAGLIGLKPGMLIEKIDGKSLNMSYVDYSAIMLQTANSMNENITINTGSYLLSYHLMQHKPGDMITVTADGKDYTVILDHHPDAASLPYLGVGYVSLNTERTDLFNLIFPIFAFIWMFSLGVATVNILPLYPLDGGLMLKALTDKYLSKNDSAAVVKGISMFILLLILFDIFGPMLMSL